jgi:pyruvate dehydrogenase E2 component (dihydrolipoamide acetyltransferase)
MEFRLPALGEGIDSATVVNVLVKPGDAVTAGQNVIAVETDKAAVEVPVETAGTIGEIRVKPGDKVPVGGVILTLQGSGAPAKKEAPVSREAKPSEPTAPAAPASKPSTPAAKPAIAPAAGASEFKLPALGEGIDSATVVNVLVKAGDAVTAGQNVIAVETDKAAVEVPVETAGTVAEVRVKAGDKIPVGAVILTFTGGEAAKMPAGGTSVVRPASPPANGTPRTTAPLQTDPSAPTAGAAVISEAATNDQLVVPAGPATRRLARELGVVLGGVRGTARGGRITIDDVKAFVKTRMDLFKAGTAAVAASTGRVVDAFALPPLPDFSKYGEVEKKPVSNIRKKIAENLTIAWRTMPMVTQNDLADITELEAGRKRTVESLPKGSPKITMTVLAVKAVVAALKEFPNFNASYDMNAGELVLKKYFHIGLAVDTERGLVVPVIRDADRKSIRDLAAEVTTLAEKARTGKLTIDEMRGGCFTITNLGGIGGTSFTPIVNYPEVAILGMSRSAQQPIVKDGQIVPRLMLPLSLTYDHRVIDGADGARFTAKLVQLFSDPIRLLMEA